MKNLSFDQFQVTDWGYTQDSKPSSFKQYSSWLNEELHGPLNYLADHRRELREDIKNFYPDFQSALVFLFSYHQKRNEINVHLQGKDTYNGKKIASYALCFEGEDYHYTLKEKLKEIGESLKEKFEGLEYQLTLDVHPVLERDLAFKAGLGWFGKNSMLISSEHGSFSMIGSLLFNQKLPVDVKAAESDHCGTCTACIDVCPTEAILADIRQIDAGKCISTFTIEQFKEVDPPKKYENVKDEIYGCDLCQDVCPWNTKIDKLLSAKNIKPSQELKKILDYFLLRPESEVMKDLEESSNKGFQKKFKGSVFSRTGRVGLLKNFKALK